VVNSRRFRNIVILIVIIFLCLTIVTISFRGSNLTERIKAKTLDIFEPVQEKVFSFFNPVTEFFSSIGDYIGLRQKYEDLEKENAALLREYVEITSIRVENDALRKLLDMELRREHEVTVVKVIGYYENMWQTEILVNAGTADGIQEGMGVIGDRGLVGVVISVGNSSARVRMINDPQSSLGVRILSSRKLGLAEGSQEGNIYLKYISREEEVYKGNIIVTSEYSQYFPADLLVGRVSGIKDIPGEPYLEITVEPFEDLKRLEYLMVIRK